MCSPNIEECIDFSIRELGLFEKKVGALKRGTAIIWRIIVSILSMERWRGIWWQIKSVLVAWCSWRKISVKKVNDGPEKKLYHRVWGGC